MQQPTDFLHHQLPIADCIAQTAEQDLPYLQILPPAWVLADPLYIQMDALGKLYRQGRSVWAAVAWADEKLLQAGEEAHAAEVVYDPSGNIEPAVLQQVAEKLAAARQRQPEARSPRLIRPIPPKISTQPLFTAHLLIWRPHLPNGILSERLLPILVDESCEAVTPLPSRYWAQSSFYRQWIGQNGAETAPAFQAALEFDSNFWKGFHDLVRPHRGELPNLGKTARMPQKTTADERGKQLVRGCRWQASLSHPRQTEKIPAENLIADVAAKLNAGDTSPFNPEIAKYAQLRNSSFHNALAAFADESAARQLGRPAMPKIGAMIAGGNPSPVQTALLLGALYKSGCKGNSSAYLYLSYLYAKGRFVPQSLREAAAWMETAVRTGDWRALEMQAEMLLAVPASAPEILGIEAEAALRRQSPANSTNPKQIGRLQEQFLQHPLTCKQAVRSKLEQAAAAGSLKAAARLQELTADGTLPAEPAPKQHHNIHEWLNAHLSSWTPSHDEIDRDIILMPANTPMLADSSEDDKPEWFKIAVFGGIALLILLFMIISVYLIK